MVKILLTIIYLAAFSFASYAQGKLVFKSIPFDSMGVTPYNLYTTRESVTWITSSAGLWGLRGMNLTGPVVSNGFMYEEKGRDAARVKIRQFLAEDSIRKMVQGPDSLFYFVTKDNFFVWRPDGIVNGLGFPPFILPDSPAVSALLIHENGDLIAGTNHSGFFVIEGGGRKNGLLDHVESGWDQNNKYVIIKGGKKIRHVKLPGQAGAFAFAADLTAPKNIWVGTNQGLFIYQVQTGRISAVEEIDPALTITDIETGVPGLVIFSTLEKGIGVFNTKTRRCGYYFYRADAKGSNSKAVMSLSYLSPHAVLAALPDQSPAVFHLTNRIFQVIEDSVMSAIPGGTRDLTVDSLGRLIVIKGNRLFISDPAYKGVSGLLKEPSPVFLVPLFTSVQLRDNKEIASLDFHPELLKKLELSHRQNSIRIVYDAPDFSQHNPLQFAWKLDGYTGGWVEMPQIYTGEEKFIMLDDLRPGKYLLQLKVRPPKGEWRTTEARMEILIRPPFWNEPWFLILLFVILIAIIVLVAERRVRNVRSQENLKTEYERQILQLEARALRAQMNPHFIFNCLNSIKALMQEGENEKGVTYLTTFSKLIRTLFNNADKKEVSLHDEIVTCKYYLELEAMRFGSKLSYSVDVDPELDLKSVFVPALIIQPFIENAIWHGIVPRASGGTVALAVSRHGSQIHVTIEDDGIGRTASMANQAMTGIGHQSKGVNLTQERIKLDNLIRQQGARMEVTDKNDSSGKPLGTLVTLTFNILE